MVAGNSCSQCEIKAVAAQRFVLIHGADGLDHLTMTGTPEGQTETFSISYLNDFLTG